VPARDVYHNTVSDGCESHILFDDDRGQYLILDLGWNDDKYLHATPIHISLIEDKIWVQYDDTEEGVVTDLTEAGVPKEIIVLGFRHPKVRQNMGFAIA
jgi:XisI protein